MALGALHTNVARRLATALVVLALLFPLLRNEDGLPLSTYPMYAGSRSETLTIVTARGVAVGGEAVTLSMPQIAETRDPLIAQSFLNDAVASDKLEIVCLEIAARVENAAAIEISSERRNIVEHARGRDSLIEREDLFTCTVPK